MYFYICLENNSGSKRKICEKIKTQLPVIFRRWRHGAIVWMTTAHARVRVSWADSTLRLLLTTSTGLVAVNRFFSLEPRWTETWCTYNDLMLTSRNNSMVGKNNDSTARAAWTRFMSLRREDLVLGWQRHVKAFVWRFLLPILPLYFAEIGSDAEKKVDYSDSNSNKVSYLWHFVLTIWREYIWQFALQSSHYWFCTAAIG